MLIGSFSHSVDPKGRIIFPVKFREEIGAAFYIVRWRDGCLSAFSEEEFLNVCTKLKAKETSIATDLMRKLSESACEVEPDKQGRILIDGVLRESAGISSEVTLIGMMNRVEIWDKERWQARSRQIDSDKFDELMRELDM